MKNLFSQLNLRPTERRFLILVLVALFFVLNLWFIWPRFGDVGKNLARNELLKKDIAARQAEIARASGYQSRLASLTQKGSGIKFEDAPVYLQKIVIEQSEKNRLALESSRIVPVVDSEGKKSSFYDEKLLRVNAVGSEGTIVAFLHGVCGGDSPVRVRELDIKPDSSRSKLSATITFGVSFLNTEPSKARKQ